MDPNPNKTSAEPEPDARSEAPAPGLDEGYRENLPLTTSLESSLDIRENGEGKTWRERLVEALLKQAVEGNLRAIQEIWTRLEGKPGAAASTDSVPPVLSEEAYQKILQASRGDHDDHDDDEHDETEESDGSDDCPDA